MSTHARRLRLGGLVVAVISFGAAAFGLGLPRSPLITSTVDVHVYALVALAFAAGVVCAACLLPPAFVRRSAPRTGADRGPLCTGTAARG